MNFFLCVNTEFVTRTNLRHFETTVKAIGGLVLGEIYAIFYSSGNDDTIDV